MKVVWIAATLATASLTAQACSDTSARTPAAVLGKAGSDIVGRRIEAQRISSAVIGPWEVDPDLNRKDMPYAVMKSEALHDVFSQEALRIAIDHGYVTGFANTLSTNDSELPHDRRLKNFVMRFPDADAAAAASYTKSKHHRHSTDRPALYTIACPKFVS